MTVSDQIPAQPRIGLVGYECGEEEITAFREVLASGTLTGGSRTARFEAAFAARHQVDHAVAVANGTVALTAMYLALGIGPGDEVIVPSMTFVSSATSIAGETSSTPKTAPPGRNRSVGCVLASPVRSNTASSGPIAACAGSARAFA